MHEGACNRADHPALDATRATPPGRPGHPEQRRCARAHEGQVALRDGLSRQLVLGLAEFTGFLPAAWRDKGASCVLRSTPLSADEGIQQEAEFVAFWVGQNVPALGAALADVGGSGSESEQPL